MVHFYPFLCFNCMLQTKYSANYSVNVNLVCLVKICIIWWLIWYTMSKHPHLHPIPPKHRKDAAPCLLWCKLLITTSTSQGLLFCQVVWGVYGVINGIRENMLSGLGDTRTLLIFKMSFMSQYLWIQYWQSITTLFKTIIHLSFV